MTLTGGSNIYPKIEGGSNSEILPPPTSEFKKTNPNGAHENILGPLASDFK